jgi:hypothetical protein
VVAVVAVEVGAVIPVEEEGAGTIGEDDEFVEVSVACANMG